jgi:hypothetical protein
MNQTEGSVSRDGAPLRVKLKVVTTLLVASFLPSIRADLFPFVALLFVVGICVLLVELTKFNRVLGIASSITTLTPLAIYATYFVCAQWAHAELTTKLKAYPNVSVFVSRIPLPRVSRLEIHSDINDVEFAEILSMEGMEQVRHYTIESDGLTDDSLEMLMKIPEDSYVWLDCQGLTDFAINQFAQARQDCRIANSRAVRAKRFR